jgi:membrane protein implicated in regulation of membrane protease activity
MVDTWALGLGFIIGGIVLLLLEAATPGFFIAIPATVLIVIGIVGVLVPDFTFFSIVAPIAAVAITIPVTIITIFLYKRLAPPSSSPTTTVGDSLIGKEGIVTKTIIPDSIKGKVKIDNTIWSARAEKEIPEGKRVRVTSAGGVHVVVEEMRGGGSSKEQIASKLDDIPRAIEKK